MKKNKIFSGFVLFIIFSSVYFGISQNDDLIERREAYTLVFLNNGPDIQFYLTEDENDSSQGFRYTLDWISLIEFSDTNDNGVFDRNSDSIDQEINFDDLNFVLREIWGEEEGINDELVQGKQFNFTANINNGATVSIAIFWWDDDVKIPYAEDFLIIKQEESKFTVFIKEWNFASQNNKLSLTSQILTTTPLEEYSVVNLDNGTFGMLTLDDNDGKGHKGGLINNPSDVVLDSSDLGQVETLMEIVDSKVQFQYNFPSFTDSLLYDPSYSAVATPTLPSEFNSTETSTNNPNQGIPGFEIGHLIFSFILILILVRSGKRKIHI